MLLCLQWKKSIIVLCCYQVWSWGIISLIAVVDRLGPSRQHCHWLEETAPAVIQVACCASALYCVLYQMKLWQWNKCKAVCKREISFLKNILHKLSVMWQHFHTVIRWSPCSLDHRWRFIHNKPDTLQNPGATLCASSKFCFAYSVLTLYCNFFYRNFQVDAAIFNSLC